MNKVTKRIKKEPVIPTLESSPEDRIRYALRSTYELKRPKKVNKLDIMCKDEQDANVLMHTLFDIVARDNRCVLMIYSSESWCDDLFMILETTEIPSVVNGYITVKYSTQIKPNTKTVNKILLDYFKKNNNSKTVYQLRYGSTFEMRISEITGCNIIENTFARCIVNLGRRLRGEFVNLKMRIEGEGTFESPKKIVLYLEPADSELKKEMMVESVFNSESKVSEQKFKELASLAADIYDDLYNRYQLGSIPNRDVSCTREDLDVIISLIRTYIGDRNSEWVVTKKFYKDPLIKIFVSISPTTNCHNISLWPVPNSSPYRVIRAIETILQRFNKPTAFQIYPESEREFYVEDADGTSAISDSFLATLEQMDKNKKLSNQYAVIKYSTYSDMVTPSGKHSGIYIKVEPCS